MSKRRKRQDIGKTLAASDGRCYRVTQILVARKTGERSCRALVHTVGWVDFIGRSCDKIPEIKFRHLRSKIQAPPGRS